MMRRMASIAIHTQEAIINAVSTAAERFSTLPWPKACSASAGRSERRTDVNVSSEAMRSIPECAASLSIPSEPVSRPVMSFSSVMPDAARNDVSAAVRFA